MIDKFCRLLDARPFVPFKLQVYGETYLVPGPYHANYHPPTGYVTIFLDDDNHALIYGPDIELVAEGIGNQ